MDGHGMLFSFAALVLASGFQICLADCDVLLARIEALEIQGEQQHDLLHAQNERLLQQEDTISALLEWKQRQDLSSRTPPVDGDQISRDQTETGNEEDDDVKDVTKRVHGLGNEEPRIRKDNVRPSRLVLGSAPAVAFHAVLYGLYRDSPPLAYHEPVIFKEVNLNLGNGYNNVKGEFKAPAPGLYLFSTSVVAHNSTLDLSMRKNGVTLVAPYAESLSGYDQGSVSVVTQLQTGDTIYVEHRRDGHAVITGNYASSFTGILITPL